MKVLCTSESRSLSSGCSSEAHAACRLEYCGMSLDMIAAGDWGPRARRGHSSDLCPVLLIGNPDKQRSEYENSRLLPSV